MSASESGSELPSVWAWPLLSVLVSRLVLLLASALLLASELLASESGYLRAREKHKPCYH